MKKPEKSSLLNKILHSNLLIVGFFVMLVWMYATVTSCYFTYHNKTEKYQSSLNDYTNLARETINTAVTHSEHIIKSSFMEEQLENTELSTSEMLEFYEYAEEILAHNSGVYGTIRIYHTNETLYESRRFSLLENLPDSGEIRQQLDAKKSRLIFRKDEDSSSNVTMYRLIQRNRDSILEYPILLEKISIRSYPVQIILKTDATMQESGYYQASLNEELVCRMKIPQKEIATACLNTFFVCLLVLILLGTLIYALSKNTSKKTVEQINEFMDSLTGETLLYESNFFHTTYDLYELDILKNTLQKLARDIKSYSDAVKSAELENQRLEMELLSMQLDPHMLYNSLASIRLDAYRIQNQKIMDLVDNMVLYYRDVLKKDRKSVTVEQEVESIRKYLYINELSHEKEYHLETEIDESLRHFRIPSQILHTFVENCIVHGLSGNNKDCIIRISMKEADGIITTEIFDNGYGMTPEKLKELNQGTQEPRHIGIKNSLKRLKLFFGEESAIWFESEKNSYTKVMITFPKNTTTGGHYETN